MPALRRSNRIAWRAGSASNISQEERFERLIQHVQGLRRDEDDWWQSLLPKRPFQIQNFIIDNLGAHQQTTLEALPIDLLFEIFDKMTRPDLAMLSLTSKTLAGAVAVGNYQRGLHANISRGGIALHSRVEAYLGAEYKYCVCCHKFRSRRRDWWLAFAEYESPGIVTNDDKTTEKVHEAIDEWREESHNGGVENRPQDQRYPYNDQSHEAKVCCPAHALLKEDKKGKRLIGKKRQ